MPKELTNKSVYDTVPGLREANKGGSGGQNGLVKSAIRKLGFEEGQQALAPAPEKPKPLSPVKNPVLRDKLSQHLVASGRSNGEATTSKLGGERSAQADQRREQHAKTVLTGMESATQENQTKMPKELRGDVPLTHAVSAHGPESDQIGRLVHGRRADEKVPDGLGDVTLTGNSQLGDKQSKAHTTVGSGGSNTSGAFLDHFSMLRVTNEAFAQAGMLDRYAQGEGKGKTAVDKERFVTTISNTKGKDGKERDPVGYNLEMQGHSKQSPTIPLASDEMQRRFESIKRDDTMHNATVVLDPSYNEAGKRVGWNLQTAYANTNTPSESYSKPGDVGGKSHDKVAAVESLKKLVAKLKPGFETAQSELGKAKSLVTGKTNMVNGKTKALENKRKPLDLILGSADPTSEEHKEATTALAKLVKDVEDAKNELAAAQKAVETAQDELDKATGPYQQAVNDLAQAEKDLKAFKQTNKTPEPEGESEGGGNVPKAGYDPVAGKWTGDRPEKPSEYADLKGVDKDGKPLTAHHLYPWNKIQADLNAALEAKDKAGLERIFTFGGVTVDPDFWVELQKEPAQRNYAFAETLNLNMGKICWSPSNVMMGPGSRKDDPGEEVDAKFGPKGLPTPQSAMAELFQRQGGIHKGGGLANYMLNAMRQGGVGEADKYNAQDWGYEGGKPFLKQPGVTEEGGKRVDTRSKWVFSANPKHSENEANIPADKRTLTGKVPKLASPTRESDKAHFVKPDDKKKKAPVKKH